MKAIVQQRYGSPQAVLELREIDRPVPGEGEVLVRVRASPVHADVWHEVTGLPWVLRLMGAGVLRPKEPVPGMEVAGVVEAVGPGATRFAPGVEVFGQTRTQLAWRNGGAFAEYAAVPEEALAPKPAGVSFEAAAAVPVSGYIALYNLRGGRLQAGQRVLINGAGGGVGTLAIQIAKAEGTHVTAVDSGDKLEMMRGLGADAVIDYTQEDLLRRGERYDLILDVASTLTLAQCDQILTPRGIYVFIGHDHYGKGTTGRVLGSLPRALKILARARFTRHPHLPPGGTQIPTTGEATATLANLLASGQLTPILGRTYPLGQVPQALQDLQAGRTTGKLVVTL